MKVGELVRCPRCSTENPPEYRFCGMCGTPLENPAEADHGVKAGSEPSPRQEKVLPTQRSISGPSFLGLSDEPAKGSFGEPSRDVNYLLDEYEGPPKRTYWRFTLIMIILLILGGLAWLEYTQSGKAWVAPWSKQKPSSPIQASQPEHQVQSGPTNPGQAQPQDQANQKASAPETSAVADSHPQPGSPSPPKETDLAPSGQPDNAKASNSQPTETQSAQPPTGENDKASEAAAPVSAKPTQQARRAKAKAAPEDTGESAEDTLVANAEKALYGRGVPQSCDRALISLNTAARRENARARGLLGTMYATGHCVPRDLPTAYRWFALASRQQPDNVWVQRNLEMIWREMTPQEQQLATKLRQ